MCSCSYSILISSFPCRCAERSPSALHSRDRLQGKIDSIPLFSVHLFPSSSEFLSLLARFLGCAHNSVRSLSVSDGVVIVSISFRNVLICNKISMNISGRKRIVRDQSEMNCAWKAAERELLNACAAACVCAADRPMCNCSQSRAINYNSLRVVHCFSFSIGSRICIRARRYRCVCSCFVFLFSRFSFAFAFHRHYRFGQLN